LTLQIIKYKSFFAKNTKPTPQSQHLNSIIMKYSAFKIKNSVVYYYFASINAKRKNNLQNKKKKKTGTLSIYKSTQKFTPLYVWIPNKKIS
jgi:hypothetical protein